MTYKDFTTAGELRRMLVQLPANTIIDIARDPELNGAGPIAMLEDGQISVCEERLRADGRAVVVLWPLESVPFERRYNQDEPS
jgi:hypothetical protein